MPLCPAGLHCMLQHLVATSRFSLKSSRGGFCFWLCSQLCRFGRAADHSQPAELGGGTVSDRCPQLDAPRRLPGDAPLRVQPQRKAGASTACRASCERIIWSITSAAHHRRCRTRRTCSVQLHVRWTITHQHRHLSSNLAQHVQWLTCRRSALSTSCCCRTCGGTSGTTAASTLRCSSRSRRPATSPTPSTRYPARQPTPICILLYTPLLHASILF